MVIDRLDLIDVHAIRLQVDAPGDIGVVHARCRHRRRAVLYRDDAFGVWILSRTGDPYVRLQCARDLGQGGRQSLDDAEADRAAVEYEIDAISGRWSCHVRESV